jgi:hypothetical protein
VTSTNGRKPARKPRRPRPYRDSALTYAVLGLAVVVVAFATGSGVLKSVAGGLSAFLLATAYTWWRLRQRERAPERQSQ